jgi:hypothetical protein
MNSNHPITMRIRQPRGDERTPIAALGAEALIAKNIAHEVGKAISYFLHPEARLVWRK